jgi:hypothetical protein
LCAGYDSPELIDDGVDTAPSKRIRQEIPKYAHEKPTAAPIIAARIGVETMRRKCPHFDQWMQKLQDLGTSSANTNT